MPDPDEMERLRRADPVDGASLPSPTDPEARALFEEITMADTKTTTPIRERTAAAPSQRRKTVLVGGLAAAVILVLAISALTRDGDDPSPSSPPVANGPITPGGPSSASCVDVYDLATLEHRELAFDGTVTSVEGDNVSFAVGRWFRGGDQATITLRGAAVLSGLTSAGASTGLAPGTRLLVAGDGGFAWACGFSQPYDETVAQEWARVFTP